MFNSRAQRRGRARGDRITRRWCHGSTGAQCHTIESTAGGCISTQDDVTKNIAECDDASKFALVRPFAFYDYQPVNSTSFDEF